MFFSISCRLWIASFVYLWRLSKSAKKIAFVITSTGWGGLEMNTLKLAKLLGDQGFEITLFTQENSTLFEKGKEVFSNVELIQKNRKYFDFKSAKSLSVKFLSLSISSVLVVDNKDLDVVAWCKKRYFKDLKIVYQQHMQIGINKKDWLHTFRFKMIDVWVSPLPFLKTEIGIRTKFPLSRVKVLPIGLNVSQFQERKYSKSEAKEILKIESDRALVGIIGRISNKKGQLFLVEALQKMKDDAASFDVLIFGSATVNASEDKEYAESIHAFVKNNQLVDRVHFIESQPDIARFYNAIDVFVLASHSETYGMVTIEAMLNGLPILATDSGGTTEILGNGELGALYNYNDIDDFTEKLDDILKNSNEAKQKALRAREHAFKSYNVAIEVEGFVQIFNALQSS